MEGSLNAPAQGAPQAQAAGQTAGQSQALAPGPLAGVRIVSLAEQYPGPYATLLMADLAPR